MKGLYDYGPPGTFLQANIVDTWRKHFVQEEDMLSDVTGLVRLSVGWLEKLQNRNRFGALIGLQPVGFGSFGLTG